MRQICVWLMTLALVAASQFFVNAAQAQDLRALARLDASASKIQVTGSGVDLSLSLSVPVPYRAFTLSNPPRAVLDFNDVDWRGVSAGTLDANIDPDDLRFGVFRAGWSRMVLDLQTEMFVQEVEMITSDEQGATLNVRLTAGAAQPHPNLADLLHDLSDLPSVTGQGMTLVAIDPGHGGIDPGAIREEISEKDIALAFALELREKLIATGDFSVVLTRERDVFLSLSERVRIAQAANADLMLSIHANTVTRGNAYGATVYSLSDRASDAASAALAQLENRSDVSAGLDLSIEEDDVARTLLDLARAETNPRSKRLATAMVRGLSQSVDIIRSRPHRYAGFLVLKAPDVPSLLLELGFLSNAQDRDNMLSPSWRAKAADGVINALYTWVEEDRALSELRMK